MAFNEHQTECIDVADVLPEYLRQAIPFERFNMIQTNCLETWHTDRNMIINAPTGTGKTICFELSIMRHVHKTLHAKNIKRLSSNSPIGKIVYIAPTKSICSERHADWNQRFSFLGMSVKLATGDSATYDLGTKLSNADLIITTSEMWDSATRRKTNGCGPDICKQVALLLLDEIHHISEKRGAVLESVVTRMLMAKNALAGSTNIEDFDPIESLRIVAASATVGNIRELGSWLGVAEDCIKCFDHTFRPISLQYNVLGFTAQNPWLYNRVYEKQIFNVLQRYGEGKPAIVFCTSRLQTTNYAQTLLTQVCRNNRVNYDQSTLTRSLSQDQRNRLKSYASRCDGKLLETLLPHGIAIHNADISLECRRIVEDLFKESLIMCLFSTSTLAQGVNLPARLVVIAGTTIYDTGHLKEYNRNKLLQMCGRAGRVGLDSHGVAVIMTARSKVHLYQNIGEDNAEVLESRLELDLENVINAEVARNTITDIPSATHFIKSSFFWARTLEQLSSGGDSTNVSVQATELASNSIQKLTDMNLIRYDEDLYGVGSTLAGAYMAEYCVSFESMSIIGERLPKAKRPLHVLRIISSCPELLEDVFLRRSEKKRLNELNQCIRMPIVGKVKDAVDKVYILLQVAISERPSMSTSFGNESQRLLQTGSRLCSCIVDLLLSKALQAPYESVLATLQVSRAILNKCSWSGPTILRQVHSAIVSHCQAFWKNGISSIANLAALDSDAIASVLGGGLDLAHNVRQRLRQIPKFTVEVETIELPQELARTEARSLSIKVDIASQLGNELRGKKKHGGFILVASENRSIWLLERFDMNDCLQKRFVCDITVVPTERIACIDVLVGSDSLVGIDWSGRFLYDDETKSLTSKNAYGQEKENKQKRPLGHGLSVTTGRVLKKSLGHKKNSRLQDLKHSFLTSMKKKAAAVRVSCATDKQTVDKRHVSPSEVIPPSPEGQNGDPDQEPMVSLFGTRCEGMAFRQITPLVRSLRVANLDDSVEGRAREYDDILRGLY